MMSNRWKILTLVATALSTAALALGKEKHCSDSPFHDTPVGENDLKLQWKESNVEVSGAKDDSVYLAETLSLIPVVTSSGLKETGVYVLLMEDVDAPNPEKPGKAPYQHWLKVNVPGTHLNGGEERLIYSGPKPPADSAPHRYYVALFELPDGRLSPGTLPAITRAAGSWDARTVLEEYHIKYHKPLAWTCFKATSNPEDAKAGPRTTSETTASLENTDAASRTDAERRALAKDAATRLKSEASGNSEDVAPKRLKLTKEVASRLKEELDAGNLPLSPPETLELQAAMAKGEMPVNKVLLEKIAAALSGEDTSEKKDVSRHEVL